MGLLRQSFIAVLLMAALVGLTTAPERPGESDVNGIDETYDVAPEELNTLSLADISQANVTLQHPAEQSLALVDRPAHLSLIFDAAPSPVASGSLLSNNSAYLVNSEIPFAIAFISLGGFIIAGFAIMVRESYLRQKE